MTTESDRNAGALRFPNPSRSYDEAGHGVHFWGYDQSMEVTFFVEQGALSKIDPGMHPDEAGMLSTFDVNRDRILDAADSIYSRRIKQLHRFSYTLTASEL